jgi:hypothetical protein
VRAFSAFVGARGEGSGLKTREHAAACAREHGDPARFVTTRRVQAHVGVALAVTLPETNPPTFFHERQALVESRHAAGPSNVLNRWRNRAQCTRCRPWRSDRILLEKGDVSL